MIYISLSVNVYTRILQMCIFESTQYLLFLFFFTRNNLQLLTIYFIPAT